MSEPLVALVTGASSGIGEATARRLAREPNAHLVLVARREDKLNELAAELGAPSTVIAADLTEDGAPERIRDIVTAEHNRLDLLVNNAGARWNGTIAEEGWANVERHMKLNFEAPVRLIEALLPLLRQTAQTSSRTPAIVNVASTAGRVARPKSGAYSASKFALAGWSDSLHGEELPHGVHVGLVLPGFIVTEGFPAAELREKFLTRLIVSKPEVVAEAIVDVGLKGKSERYAPRFYWLAAAARILAGRYVLKATAGGALSTATHAGD